MKSGVCHLINIYLGVRVFYLDVRRPKTEMEQRLSKWSSPGSYCSSSRSEVSGHLSFNGRDIGWFECLFNLSDALRAESITNALLTSSQHRRSLRSSETCINNMRVACLSKVHARGKKDRETAVKMLLA